MKTLIATLLALLLFAPIQAQLYHQQLIQNGERQFSTIVELTENYYSTRDKGKGTGYKLFKRWEHKNQRDLGGNSEIHNQAAIKFKAFQKWQKTSQQNAQRSAHGSWFETNPENVVDGSGWNPGHGRINTIVFHPGSQDTIYLGTPAGGLWKSEDAGTTWECLTDGMPQIGVSGIAIDPENHDIIYILTGDGDNSDSYSIGVLKSDDSGSSWQQTGLVFGFYELVGAFKLAFHSGTLYAATSAGLWSSSNGGQNFIQRIITSVVDFEFRPSSETVMYASGFKNAWISDDLGISWAEMLVPGLPAPGGDFNRVAIGVTNADTNCVYILYGGGSTGYFGLFKSNDGGSSFALQSNSPNILSSDINGNGVGHQAGYDLTIAVDPLNSNIVYFGGVNLWKSTNGGIAWNMLAHWDSNSPGQYVHGDYHFLGFNGNSNLFAGTDGGVWTSSNGGTSWTNLSEGLNILQIYDMDVAQDSNDNTVIIVGTQDNGTNSWAQSSSTMFHVLGADGFECFFRPDNTNIIYASTQGSRRISVNGGLTFTEISPHPAGSEPWGSAWKLHTTDWSTSFATYKIIYRNHLTAPNTWASIDPGFLDDTTKTIGPFEQGTNDPNVAYVSNRVEVRMTQNLSAATPTWQDATPTLSLDDDFRITSLVVDPNNAARVWASLSHIIPSKKVYYSDDYGATWSNETQSGLPNATVYRLIYDTDSEQNGLYAATEFGVFYSNDTLNQWLYFSNGLPTVPVYDLKLHNGLLYAATFGRGVWYSDGYSSCPIALTLTAASDPSNPNSTGKQVYHAQNQIISTRTISGGVGSDAHYQAGDFVRLDLGFHVNATSQFVAKVGGCPD